MAGSLEQLIRDLKTFEARKDVLKEFRREVRKPVPKVRAAIKRRALDILPSRGGLGAWVAATRVTLAVRLSGRRAGITLKGGRNSTGARSDIRRIDAGQVRAPSWGRRTAAAWHTQTVKSGFFTEAATETGEWREAAERAVDTALDVIRRG